MLTNEIPVGFDHSRRSITFGSEADDGGIDKEVLTPQDYIDMVTLYLERREDWKSRWLRNEAIYENLSDPEAKDGGGPTPSRLGRAYGIVHTLESMVFNRRPKMFVDALTTDDAEMSKLFEGILNNEWALTGDLKREKRLKVRDCIIYGFGAELTCYEAEFEKVERRRKKDLKLHDRAAADGSLNDLAQAKAEAVQQRALVEHDPELEMTVEMDERVAWERVCTLRISPWDMLVDPVARHWSQVHWIGRRLELPLRDIKAWRNYTNTEGLKADLEVSKKYWPDSKVKAQQDSSHERDTRDWVTLYEIFDLRRGRRVTVAPGHPEFLENRSNPFDVGNPYTILQWNHRGESLFAPADLDVVYNQLREEEDQRTKLHEAFSREAIDVYVTDGGMGLGEEQIRPLTLPDGSIIVPITPRGTEPVAVAQRIAPLTRTPKSPDILNYIALIGRDIQEGLGLGNNQIGLPNKSGTTASEAMEIAGFARSKGEFKYDAVEADVAETGYVRLAMYAQFVEGPEIRRIVGDEAVVLWESFKASKGDIQNRFSVKVEEGSVRPQNDMTRLATYERMFQFMLTFPWLAQVISIPELVTRWLTTLGDKDTANLLMVKDPQQIAQIAMAAMAQQQGAGGGGKPRTEGAGQQQSAASQSGSGDARGNQKAMGTLRGGAA
jgi:hypothetical protein